MDQAYLRDGIFMTIVDDDIIVLDARSDTYGLLPGAASALQLSGCQVSGASALIDDLREAGLVQNAAPVLVRRPIPKAPIRSLGSSARVNGPDMFLFALAVIGTRRAIPRRALQTLLHDAEPRRAHHLNERRVAELTAAFVRWLPWAPGQGACLYRAYLLRRFLRLAGQDAVWTFGVRTWPFSAHCWLQVDDAVLDDDPERVRLYTPIMAA